MLNTLRSIQWKLSITDTLGPENTDTVYAEKQFVVQRFPLFGGYFIILSHSNLSTSRSGHHNIVCYREVSTIIVGEVCCKRFHPILAHIVCMVHNCKLILPDMS